MGDLEQLAIKRYRKVKNELDAAVVAAGRSKGDVTLIGVTKTIDPTVVNAAIADGLSVIGENRVQEFLQKREQYHLNDVKVHFIGALQRNKVKCIIDLVDMIESVDSFELAQEISKRAVQCGKVMPILIEINIDRQTSKSGLMPECAEATIRSMAQLPGIAVRGLMCIPDPKQTPESFVRMQQLFLQIKKENIPGVLMEHLSMGMSGDYTQAVLYGATMVRVGRGIFGQRTVATPNQEYTV